MNNTNLKTTINENSLSFTCAVISVIAFLIMPIFSIASIALGFVAHIKGEKLAKYSFVWSSFALIGGAVFQYMFYIEYVATGDNGLQMANIQQTANFLSYIFGAILLTHIFILAAIKEYEKKSK